jgi:hypothetical protein
MKEIPLIDILNFLKSKFLLISITSFIFACIVSVISLNLKEVYTSDALLQLADDKTMGQALPTGAQGLASMVGMNFSSGDSKGRSPDYVMAKIKSRSFFEHLLTFDGVKEAIYSDISFNEAISRIIYNENVPESQTVKDSSDDSSSVPSNLETHIIFLSQLGIEINKKTNFIFIDYEHTSPVFAKTIIELIVGELNNLQRQQDLDQYKKEMEYLIEQKSLNKLLFLEQSLSSLLMTLLQDQTLANVKDQYLVQYIDTPFVPESRSWPQRTKLVITSTIIFSILFIFIITFRRFVLSAENY